MVGCWQLAWCRGADVERGAGECSNCSPVRHFPHEQQAMQCVPRAVWAVARPD